MLVANEFLLFHRWCDPVQMASVQNCVDYRADAVKECSWLQDLSEKSFSSTQRMYVMETVNQCLVLCSLAYSPQYSSEMSLGIPASRVFYCTMTAVVFYLLLLFFLVNQKKITSVHSEYFWSTPHNLSYRRLP